MGNDVRSTSTTEVSGVDEGGAGGVQLRYEAVVATTGGRLKGAWGDGKVHRSSKACDIQVAGSVQRDRAAR